MRTTTTTMKTTIKSKTENESLPSYPSSPTNPNVRPPTTHTAFVIHVYPPSPPPALSSFYGARLYRMGGPSGAATPFFFPSPPYHGTESHPTPSTSPTPTAQRFSGSPALSIPQFHCRSLFMYSRVRTLGLVSSFGSVLLIFRWMNNFFCCWVYYFSILLSFIIFVLFLLFFPIKLLL